MSLREGDRGSAKMEHGEIDLEALQEAFLRNREKPSAKVIRSKPPTIKAGSSLGRRGVGQEAHARASKATSDKTTDDGEIGDVVDSVLTAPVRGTSTSASFRKHNQIVADANAASFAKEAQPNTAGPAASTATRRSAGGGMVLAAPDVVLSVREREVRAPAPIKIAVGRGGAVNSSRGQGRDRRGGISGGADVLGGFPAVRHRSEMGGLKLGDLRAVAAAAEAPAVSAAAVQAKRRGTRGSDSGGGNRVNSGDGIPYEIHQENLSRVASMSASEIAEAQQEIRATLSSSAIETLMRRARDKRRGRATMDKDGSGEGGGQVGNHIVGSDLASTGDARGVPKRDILLPSGSRIGAVAGGVTPGIGKDAGRGSDRETPVSCEAPAQNASADSAAVIDPAPIVDSLASVELLGGPTCAQRVATAAGGVGSEQALQAALQMLPSEERAKSAWTLSDGALTQGGAAGRRGGQEARVDLDGELVMVAVEGMSEALHHHGDDPEKAGYTPSELVRLARSTVSGQRQLALRALAGVLVNRAAYIQRGELPPHPRLPQMLPIAIRTCMDDSNPAVALAALRATEAFLAPLAQNREEAEGRMQGLSWLDYQVFPSDVRPLCTPEEEATLPRIDNAADVGNPSGNGSSGMEEDASSAAELARMCYEDPCRGFLNMGLLPKLSSMIKTYAVVTARALATGEVDVIGGLHPRAALSCLRILRAIAERASWAAVRITREPGLLEAVKEAFLEPRADGSLLFDLSEGPSEPLSTAANRASPEHLALMAIRLIRTLVQSGRAAVLFLGTTALLGSMKGLLALGQGLHRPRQSLLSMQREVLELWRCCLSYGIDVSSADTVVLLSRSQGWWPGLEAHPDVSSLSSGAVSTGHSNSNASCLGNPAKKGTMVDVNGGREGELVIPPKLGFLRAMHQLACVCVLPLKQKEGLEIDGDVPTVSERDSQRPAVRDSQREAKEKDRAPLLLGDVSVSLDTWADVGDTVDAAVEACVRRLLSDFGSGSGQEGTVEIAMQSASIHLVACWLERYRAMSRTDGQRSVQRLETTAEDAVLLFSSLLASRSLPVAVEKGTVPSGPGKNGSSVDNSKGCRAGVVGDRTGLTLASAGDEAIGCGIAAAAVATAALDWLSGVFRLGLACDPREAALALAAAPVINSAALLNFLGANPFVLCGKEGDRGVIEGGASRRWDVAGVRRSLRRGSASARWLGCRLLGWMGKDESCASTMAAAGGGIRGKSGWEALRRDCALNAVSLCEPGQEAVAVGLIGEGIRDGSPGSQDTSRSTGAPAILRKLFRGAVSDLAAIKHASFHLDGRWSSLQSLGASSPPGTASLLPLPQHWLFLPLASQGGERAASTAVSACLSILSELEREGSSYVAVGDFCATRQGSHEAVAPEVKLYHLMNACMYGASVFSGGDDLAEENFDWLLGRYLDQCGKGFESRLMNTIARLSIASAPDPAKIIADAAADPANPTAASWARPGDGGESTARERAREAREQSHVERSLLEFVKDLVGSFLADSFGLPSFSKVLRVFVMTGFPVAARCIVWKELGAVGLLSLLDAPSSCDPGQDESDAGNDCWSEAFLYPVDTDLAILDAYLTALEHPRFEGDRLAPGGSEDNVNGCSDFGLARTAEAVVPAGVALLERGSMRTVAVHHLACYLFPVATGTAWEPDFGRRKTMERLLLHAGLKVGNEVLGSPLASVLAYECQGTKWPPSCDSGMPYRPTAVDIVGCVNERGGDLIGAIEQQGEAERGHGNGKGVVSHSSSPIQLAREEAAGTCSRRRCLRLTTLGSCRRKLLQSYFSGGRSAGILTGAVGDGGDEEAEREQNLVEWLNGEDRRVEDIIQRLLSRVV